MLCVFFEGSFGWPRAAGMLWEVRSRQQSRRMPAFPGGCPKEPRSGSSAPRAAAPRLPSQRGGTSSRRRCLSPGFEAPPPRRDEEEEDSQVSAHPVLASPPETVYSQTFVLAWGHRNSRTGGVFLHWLPEVGSTGNAGAFPDLRRVSLY